MTLDEHLAAAMEARGLVPEGDDAGMHAARYQGHLGPAMGASLAVAYAAWIRSRHPRHATDDVSFGDDPVSDANRKAFAGELAARASGSEATPVDFGDQGRLTVVRNPMPPRYDPAGLDYSFTRFADSAGRTMFADAWASRMDENGESLSGLDVLEAAPETPREAVLEGAELAGSYEAVAGCGIDALYRRALQAHFGPGYDFDALEGTRKHGLEHFASDLALQALGAGAAWDDDHESFDCPRIDHCYMTEAGLPDTTVSPGP